MALGALKMRNETIRYVGFISACSSEENGTRMLEAVYFIKTTRRTIFSFANIPQFLANGVVGHTNI